MSTQNAVPIKTYEPLPTLTARRIGYSEPIEWLREGWETFKALKTQAITFGLVFAAVGATISYFAVNNAQMTFAFWSGFLLVAPMLAMAAYHMAQNHAAGRTVSFASCSGLLRKNIGNTLLLVVFLSVVMIAWIRLSTLATAIYAGGSVVNLDLGASLFTANNLGLLATLGVVTVVVGLLMFALLAWSMPMLARGKVSFASAIVSSVKAVFEQPGPMLLWGLLVAGLTLVSMATFFVAFVVVFPWLAFATWAGYQRLFENPAK